MLPHFCQVRVGGHGPNPIATICQRGFCHCCQTEGALALPVDPAASSSGVASLLLAALMALPFHLVSHDIIPKAGGTTLCCSQGTGGKSTSQMVSAVTEWVENSL